MTNKHWLFITLLYCVVFGGCSKTSPANNEISALNQKFKTDLLHLDSNFISLVIEENNLKQILLEITDKRKISADSLLKEIEDIKIHSKDSNELQINLNKIGFPFLYEYLQHFTTKNQQNWININQKYIRLSSNDVKIACEKYYDGQFIMEINEVNKMASNSINSKSHNLVSGCGWGYNLCIAGVTAGAILCHAECIGLTAGFGAPICVSLCGTMQIAAGAGCMNSYCNFNQ